MGKKADKAVARSNAEHSRTHDLPPLALRAAIDPGSINEEKRTVDVTWTTGAPVLRGFFDRYFEELSLDPKHVRMDRLTSGSAPVLDAHSSWSIGDQIGVVQSARLEKGRGIATLRYASEGVNPQADLAWRLVADKISKNVSVGYRTYRLETIEDKTAKIPTRRATDWEPYEISPVPMGADAGAGVRSEGATTNPCEFIGLDQETRDMADKKTDTPTPAPADTPTEERTVEVDHSEAEANATKAEKQRGVSIRAIGSKLSCDDELVRTHIDKGTTPEEFRTIAIDAFERAEPEGRSDAGRPSVTPGDDTRDKWLRGAEHWLIQRSAIGHVVVEAAKLRGETVKIDPGEFRGMTMLDLARASLERAGHSTRGMSKMDIIGDALTGRAGGFQAIGDFSVLLENVMHKSLQSQFAITPDTWREFCKVGSVGDFRAHNRFRTATLNVLPIVPEGSEFKNQAQPDGEKETITAGTRGSIVEITRQALINDDMGALAGIATSMGRAAALTIESAVYTTLALNSNLGPDLNDGNPLFDSAHNNLGAGVALTVAGLEADRVVMAKQKLPGAVEFANLRPQILLVPIGLGGQARVINRAEFDTDDIGDTRTYRQPNKVLGLYTTIVDTARLTGTRRYSFANPLDAAVLEVAFLDGQQNPFLENERGFRRDGVSWKVRLDFGVAGVGERGAVTDAGV